MHVEIVLIGLRDLRQIYADIGIAVRAALLVPQSDRMADLMDADPLADRNLLQIGSSAAARAAPPVWGGSKSRLLSEGLIWPSMSRILPVGYRPTSPRWLSLGRNKLDRARLDGHQARLHWSLFREPRQPSSFRSVAPAGSGIPAITGDSTSNANDSWIPSAAPSEHTPS